MKARYHIIVSLLLSLVAYYTSQSLINSTLSFLIGVFIDIDHEIDYYIEHRKLTLNINELSHMENRQIDYFPLHAHEYLFLVFILPNYDFLFIVYAIHLLMDVVGNQVHPKRYSMIYKILKWRERK